MTNLEDRLRRDLPDLADALIARHGEPVSDPVDSPERETPTITVLPQRPDQQRDRRWKPLLVAAAVVLGLIGVGIATNAIRTDGDGTAPVVAAQLEDDSVDPVVEAPRDQEHRAALIADPPGTLDEARARWVAEGPSDYRYRLSVIKGDRTIMLDIEVTGDVARRLEPLPMPPGIDPPAIDEQWIATVEDLFELVAQAGPTIVPTFDPELGYPTAFRLDPGDTTVGGALTFRPGELSSIADIEAAERAFAAWLPEPSMLPPELASSRFLAADTELYQLHDAGDFVVNLVRQQRDVCVLVTRRDPSSGTFTGASQAHCESPTTLRDEGLSTRTISAPNPTDPLMFLAILPASHHGQDWEPAVTTDRDYELMSTDESVLIVFGDNGTPGRVRIEINCECGELVYEPRIGS